MSVAEKDHPYFWRIPLWVAILALSLIVLADTVCTHTAFRNSSRYIGGKMQWTHSEPSSPDLYAWVRTRDSISKVISIIAMTVSAHIAFVVIRKQYAKPRISIHHANDENK